jgi:CDP-diacylglycerol pyrophosphatase
MPHRYSPARSLCCLGALLACIGLVNACRPANRDALRQIVQNQCAVHWLEQHSASPCERIYLPEAPHEREGFALLHDIKGGGHFLLIPTKTIAGMESAALFEPGTPNYFAAAWSARDLLAASVEHRLPRDAIGLALNPRHARTQDQLHIHIECVRVEVAGTLRAAAPGIKRAWSPLAVGGWTYQAFRVMGEGLDDVDPIALLADELPVSRTAIGHYTLVVVGMSYREGPGFVLLAANGPAGELLLDPTCAIAALP